MNIEINNLTSIAVDKAFFLGVAKKVLKGENRVTDNISIAFVGLKDIHELNKKCRGKDAPTDVLSFGKVSGFVKEFLEVIICPAVVRENSKNSSLSLKKEMAKVLIHGMLHVMGYEHEQSIVEQEKMFERQKYYELQCKLF
jgi:probable rRNA maturation factor